MDAAAFAARECRKLREPWPMFCSDFSKPHSKCMRNSLLDWSELSAFYTEYKACQKGLLLFFMSGKIEIIKYKRKKSVTHMWAWAFPSF
uniref:Uncharacterized protein n=1 Tax=Caenorhabditis japonica TaxID=281687 RepID=A0A8R1EQK7_CAEJA